MGKTYRTAQGKSLDIEKLKLQNELVPAIGNMRVNARGDQLGPGGKVVKSREEMLDQHYKANISNRRKGSEPDVIPTRAGKASDIEPKTKFAPGDIVADPIAESLEPEVLEDDFVDPEETVTAPEPEPVVEEEVAPKPKPAAKKGSKALKGGLARAVAKTRDYEDKKNKPKRI